MKIKFTFLLLSTAISSLTFAQSSKYSNEFLRLGMGAQSFGMAGSVLTERGSAESAYWNPSNLVSMKDTAQASFMHSNYYNGIANYNTASFALKLNSKTAVALSVIRFGVDDIMNTTQLIDDQGNVDYNRISLFSAADYALLATYSKKTTIPGLNLGANVKLIYRQIGSFANAFGMGTDISATYTKSKMTYAFVVSDLTTSFASWSFSDESLNDKLIELGQDPIENGTEYTLPHINMAIGRSFPFKNKISLKAELGTQVYFDGERNASISSSSFTIEPNVGLELNYNQIVYLRTGVNNFQTYTDFGKEKISFQPSIGMGAHYKSFQIDYGFTDVGNASISELSHVFSLKYHFSKL